MYKKKTFIKFLFQHVVASLKELLYISSEDSKNQFYTCLLYNVNNKIRTNDPYLFSVLQLVANQMYKVSCFNTILIISLKKMTFEYFCDHWFWC